MSSVEPVVTAACFFCCRRAMGATGTRPSLRPLIWRGRKTDAQLGHDVPRERICPSLRGAMTANSATAGGGDGETFDTRQCYVAPMMTSTDIRRASIATTPRDRLAWELIETLRLAVPMALTQLSQIAMITTDLVFIGRLGGEAVAAAALANTVYWVSFTFGMGLMSAVAPLAAQAFGADKVPLVRRSLRT